MAAFAELYDEAKLDQAVRLAQMALDECRTSLMMAFRYLDRALWRLPMEPSEIQAPLATDGQSLRFNPFRVVVRYKESPYELSRDYLHTVLHCILRHPFDTQRDDTDAWSLACDIAVEAMALEIGGKRFPSAFDKQRSQCLFRWQKELGEITPAKIYRMLEAASPQFALVQSLAGGTVGHHADVAQPIDPLVQSFLSYADLFARDSHEAWSLHSYVKAKEDASGGNEEYKEDDSEESAGMGAGEGTLGDADGDAEQSAIETAEASDEALGGDDAPQQDAFNAESQGVDNFDEADQQSSYGLGTNEDDEAQLKKALDKPREESDLVKEWEEIARQVEVDLNTLSQRQGDDAGTLVTNLAIRNRRQVDYSDFLRRFSTMAEDIQVNMDEFDYVFYTYGLQKYGNMPIIEPLEYQERNRVREFVIAIDTSGSCAGDLVKRFITRTFEILKDSEQFGDHINVHIIQCDSQIQQDTALSSLEELEKFAESFEVRGMGGTDFRPVFNYVGELRESGEFDNLRGLIYFTDGLGTYPEMPPPYDTAFVFVEESGIPCFVPPWAMKVVMDEDTLAQL